MGRIIKFVAILVVLFSVGTASAASQTGSIAVYLENVEGNLSIYQTDDYLEEDPDELAAFIKRHSIRGNTKPIAAGTPTVFKDLPQGRYLVTHQEAAFRPFFVTIPITINGTTSFAVVAKPKTQELQTPQTGDPVKLYPLFALLFLSVIGVVMMAAMKYKDEKSSADGKMFLKRVQNKQKRLP